METEQKKPEQKEPEKQLSKWQRDLQEKFNKTLLNTPEKSGSLSKETAKKLLGEGLVK